MKSFLNPSKKEMNLMALSYLAFGLILCFLSASILILATRILGGFITLIGAYFLYLFFFKRSTVSYSPFMNGSIGLVFGLFLLISPETILSFLPIVTGILLIFNSISHIQKALVLKDVGAEDWIISFLVAFVILGAGILILLKPIQALSFILQIIGICLIVEAIVILITKHSLNKYDLLD